MSACFVLGNVYDYAHGVAVNKNRACAPKRAAFAGRALGRERSKNRWGIFPCGFPCIAPRPCQSARPPAHFDAIQETSK